MHPDRKPGVFKGNRRTGMLVGELGSLTRTVAAAFGITERWAFKLMQVGDRLTAEEAALLDGARTPISVAILKDLAKVGAPDERLAVVRLLAAGKAASVTQARGQVRAADPDTPSRPNKDRVEEAFKALCDLWSRSPKGARRRFVESEATAIRALLDGPVDDGAGGEA